MHGKASALVLDEGPPLYRNAGVCVSIRSNVTTVVGLLQQVLIENRRVFALIAILPPFAQASMHL